MEVGLVGNADEAAECRSGSAVAGSTAAQTARTIAWEWRSLSTVLMGV